MQVSLISDKNKRFFTWKDQYFFLSYRAPFFSEWEMFQTKVVEKIKTQLYKNHAVYDVMWKNIVQYTHALFTLGK
jgi:hypothetical protein